jgi:hypothetical protein
MCLIINNGLIKFKRQMTITYTDKTTHATSAFFVPQFTSNFTKALLMLFLAVFGIKANAQSSVFTDDFSNNNSATYTTTGNIGSTSWTVARSGNDLAARINNNRLELTNDASATNNANGWVFTAAPTSTQPCFTGVLNNNSGPVTWSFNMRQSLSDPGGFGSNTFGVAFVLGSTDASVATNGSGYAVVLGQTGSTDPVRLVRYNNGLRGTLTNIISSNTSGLTDFGSQYLSVRVIYTPATDTWQLLLRNDGASAFASPASGTLVSQGTAVNNTYTGSSLSFSGAYFQGGTTASQGALFDNVSVTKTIVPPTVGTITQPTCTTPTGSVTLTGLPATGNWLITQVPGGNTTIGSGTSTAITGLGANTYNYTVSDYNYGYQATLNSCGYSAVVVIEPFSIVPLDNPCTSGYNYNVEFNYTITISGINTCWNGDVGIQPLIFCNSQNNGYYTIRVPAPTVGAASTTVVYKGTLTTTTRPFATTTDCATANIFSQNCNQVDIQAFGPGIASSTFPTTLTTSSGCPSAPSANVVINAAQQVSITSQPTSIGVCGNSTATFTVGTAASNPSYQWQRKAASASANAWAAIGSGIGATGTSGPTLTIANPESNGWNNFLVRAVVTSSGCQVESDSALIEVDTLPTAPTAITSAATVVSTVPVIQSFTTNVGSGNSISVNKPSGVQVGDLLFMGFTFENGTGVTITPPNGWILIARTNQGSNLGMATYYRIATSTDVAASNYAFTVNNSPEWSVGVVRITGYNTNAPIAGFNAQSSSSSSANVSAPSVAAAPANSLVLALYTNEEDATYTPAANTTELYDAPNIAEGEPSNMLAYFTQTTAGATGARVAVASNSDRWAAQQIVVAPFQYFTACLGSPIELTASGGSAGSGSSFQWGTGTSVGSNPLSADGQTIIVTATDSTAYWVRRVGNTGCTAPTAAATANTDAQQPNTSVSVNGNTIAAGDYLWTGNTNTQWNTTANWLSFNGSEYSVAGSLPSTTTNIFVVSLADAVRCVSNTNVTVTDNNHTAQNVNIGSGASVTLLSNFNLNVSGNWVNLGTFIPNNGSVTFNGSANQTILSGLGTGTTSTTKSFNNIVVANKLSGGHVTLLDNLLVAGSLTVTTGELRIPLTRIARASSFYNSPAGKLLLGGELRLND